MQGGIWGFWGPSDHPCWLPVGAPGAATAAGPPAGCKASWSLADKLGLVYDTPKMGPSHPPPPGGQLRGEKCPSTSSSATRTTMTSTLRSPSGSPPAKTSASEDLEAHLDTVLLRFPWGVSRVDMTRGLYGLSSRERSYLRYLLQQVLSYDPDQQVKGRRLLQVLLMSRRPHLRRGRSSPKDPYLRRAKPGVVITVEEILRTMRWTRGRRSSSQRMRAKKTRTNQTVLGRTNQ